jgi:3-oxoacyl-[acyl-carrier-protein] synthase-3
MRSKIVGTGSYLPKKIVTNDEMAQHLETSDEWIRTRTGIRERHFVDLALGESTSSMGTIAAKNALEMANIKATDLDLIITATVTPDYRLPSTSCMIQENLQAFDVPSVDIGAACAGSIYALSFADSYIKSGKYKNVLVIASETMSSVINQEDRNTAILFGDGASAAVLSASHTESGFIDIDLYSDGRQKDIITVLAGGSVRPITAESLRNKEDKVVMNGRETYKFAVRAMCDAIVKIAKKNNVDCADIAFAVPHQANLRIIEAIGERMGIPLDRFLINLDRCANTSAASLLLVYDEAVRRHSIKEGDLILMLAIGAGFSWGAGLYRA